MFERQRSKTKNGGRVLLLGAAALVLGATQAAHAERLATGVNNVPRLFTDAPPQSVDINGTQPGATLTLDNCFDGDVAIITFTAECSHSGNLAQYGTIGILLNGASLGLTAGNDDIFCSGNATVGVHDGIAMHTVQTVGRCRAGNNTVAVTARSVFGGTTLRLDDTVTIVHN
jgi:hypothetical protein